MRGVRGGLRLEVFACFVHRFNIIIGTRGARDVLTTEREFNAFKGFEVVVSVSG
jgi:ribosome maturation factor RimP